MRKVVTYFFIFILASCNHVLQDANIIQVDIAKAKSIPFSDWFSCVELIPLETNKSSLIYTCDKMEYEHQRFYIHDFRQHAVFVFDSTGTFLFSTLTSMGQGPGEYVSITDFCINPYTGNLEILDAFSSLIRVYDKDGTFIKNIILDKNLLPMGNFIPLSSDLYLFDSPDYEKTKTSIKVFSVSKKEIVKRIVPIYDNTRHLASPNSVTFSRLNDDVLFSHRFWNNDVYQIDTTAEITGHYQYDFGKYTLDLKTLPSNRNDAFYLRYDETYKDNYIFPYKKPENLKYRFCFFAFKDNLYVSRQDKENSHLEIISNKFIDGGQILPQSYLDDDYLYNVAEEPSWLKEMLTKEMLTPEQQEIVSGIKEDDNPIILRFKIK